ncbi:hypothetical protein BegalDRAFT_3549 [Beggiatoa alba B18LD]|uniref:Uncharacterized protein n=1 Tax=Beggiatoa alba B18LD TaxID=395493 RepID=I3CL64_9GAMM|nr:hypothetical protein [Beggiatoa alba]EIJ44357.1 hypothetical protein BegalDRAFT_3549 [Beggiatoa alba B18LD]
MLRIITLLFFYLYNTGLHAEWSCTCPQGEQVATDQRCVNPQTIEQALAELNQLIPSYSAGSLAGTFFNAEQQRIQNGVLQRLSCGELTLRRQLLPDIGGKNRNRAQVAIKSLESLYQSHHALSESAKETYFRQYAPRVMVIDRDDAYYRGFYNDDWRYSPHYYDRYYAPYDYYYRPRAYYRHW